MTQADYRIMVNLGYVRMQRRGGKEKAYFASEQDEVKNEHADNKLDTEKMTSYLIIATSLVL